MQPRTLSKKTIFLITFILFFNLIAWILILHLIFTAYLNNSTSIVINFNAYNEMTFELVLIPAILGLSLYAFVYLIRKLLNVELLERRAIV